MNTIEKLGDEETFRQIVERSITSFTDDELTAIADYSFYGCKELQEVSLPLVTELPQYAFFKCSKLTSFDLANIVKINNSVFSSCGFTEVNGPLVTSIGSSAFSSCSSLSNVEFPKVTSIESSTFYSCSSLSNVEFPEVTSIGSSAFSSCSNLSNVKFPKVTSIQNEAFYDCSSLSSLIVGTELDDETAICTLNNTNAIPSGIGAIYVPYNLQEQYKTATNWSGFASKIQAYETPVSCQSLTITAEDVPGYKTSTTVHYEAICTYSIEGMLQTGTKVFKGDAVSDTFSANPSEESSRQVEVSYIFLGQTATTTITQDKYLGNPVGGKIYYIDDTADGIYSFYDAEGNLMSNVSVGSTPSYYKVITPGSKDKYYVYHDEIYNSLRWTYCKNGSYAFTWLNTGTAIGTGKSNTATVLAADGGAYVAADSNGYPTIWYKLQQIRNASTGECSDWFIPSKDELEKLKLAVKSGSITEGTIAGSSYAESMFSKQDIWPSSECASDYVWLWGGTSQKWFSNSGYKGSTASVFFARAF